MSDTCARAEKAEAQRDALAKALGALISECDKGRRVTRPGCGVGGQTTDATIKASNLNGIWAWAVEEARAALDAIKGGK